MQDFAKRFSVIAGFGLLLAVLVFNAFYMRREIGKQMGDESWVTHTRQVLFETEQTESLLKDAETGQRGYLYTGDPDYLAPYNNAVSQIEPHIENLARLTADNPSQQDRVAWLRSLTHQKLGELANTISLYQSGRTDEARAAVMSNLGKSYMDDIRGLVTQMEQEERSLEAERLATYQRSQRNTVAAIYIASCLAAMGLLLLAFYVLRGIRLRETFTSELAAREEQFRVTLSGIGDGVIATDRHGKVTFLNPVAEQLIGTNLGNSKGKSVLDVFPIFNEVTHQPAENPVNKVLELGIVVGMANHTVLMSGDGTLIPIEDSAAPIRNDRQQLIGVVMVFRDATKERKAQEVLRKTEKLTSAARLAASVAHEINNPLAAATNLIYLAKYSPETHPNVAQLLGQAEQELKRVAHITQQTLGFYRESMTPGPIALPSLVESVLSIYSNKFKSKEIKIETDFGECPPVRGVEGELKQVISNLISNAADAVDRHGTIAVKLRCIEGAKDRCVQVTIEDDGPGIAEENAKLIFEPFFTTKKDVGTGLGLWVTKEIVERHGGNITVGPGIARHGSNGASFSITMPLDTGAHNGPLKHTPVSLEGDPLTNQAS